MSQFSRLLAMVVATLVAVGASMALSATSAGAHTDFVGSDPEHGAKLDEVPLGVNLEFSDDMDPQLSAVTVRVDSGRSTLLQVTAGAKRTVLVAAVPDALAPPDGSATRWTVTFRVVSRDGHPVVGTTQFVVRPPRTPSASAPSGEGGSTGSDETSAETDTELEAAGKSSADPSDDRAVWPVVALGVGALLLLAGAVGATMRLVGRERDA